MNSIILALACALAAQPTSETIVVRPSEIDDVLVNPGIGFTTFQRFDGQPRRGRFAQEGYYPASSVAYFRIDWRELEPEPGQYDWKRIDDALESARRHNQTLMIRLPPHGYSRRDGNFSRQRDVPAWYREMVGEDYKSLPVQKWNTDPEDPRFAECYARFIRAFGERYDGHPDLDSVDLAIVGAWGEGAGAHLLSQKTREALIDSYTDSIKKTPLMTLLMDEKSNKYALSQGALGWRADCLGDMGGFQPNWSHMQDRYPQAVIQNGLTDAWKKGPVSFEACWVMSKWKDEGWSIDYIIEQSLKWHISTFNAKSSYVPLEWKPAVDGWLKRMGYRFVLRKFSYPATVAPNSPLAFQSWWENKGVAPCYKKYPLALRLTGEGRTEVLTTNADIRTWLPGDIVHNDEVTIPDLPAGEYDLSIAMLHPISQTPKIKLAIAGIHDDGWYPLGKITIASEVETAEK